MRRTGALVVILLSLSVSLAYLQAMLAHTGGIVALPLDDTYIYLQYAKRLAEGSPNEYIAGEPRTSGTTSLLYPLLLAPGALLGLSGDALAGYALALGALLFAASALVLYSLLCESEPPSQALASTLLFVITGPIAWGFHVGMEIGLVVLLALLAMRAVAREVRAGRLGLAPLWLSLVAVSRPEPMIYAVVVTLLLLGFERSRSARSLGARLWLGVPLLAALLVPLVTWALTGEASASASRPKSPLFTPDGSLLFLLQHATGYWLFVIKGLLGAGYTPLGLGPRNAIDALAFVPPLSLLFYLVGGLAPAIEELKERRLGARLLLGLWFLLGLGIVGVASGQGHHNFRYLLPFLPGFVAFLVPGALRLASALGKARERALGLALLGFLFVFQAVAAPGFALQFGQHAYGFTLFREAALWMREYLPRDARIAALDVGYVAYYSERPIFDLLGLTTRSMRASTFYFADTMGGKYEAIARLAAPERPGYFFGHRVRFDELGDEAHLSWLRKDLLRSFRPTSPLHPVIGTDLGLYRLRWPEGELERAHALCTPEAQASAPATDASLVVSLDLADLEERARAGFEIDPAVPGAYPAGRVVEARCGSAPDAASPGVLRDAIVGVSGALRFRILLDAPAELYLVLRTNWAREPIQVRLNGKPAGKLELGDLSGSRWQEPGIAIPAARTAAAENWLELDGVFAAAHVWVWAR